MCAFQVEYERRGVSSASSAAAELLGVGATTESQERLETGDGACGDAWTVPRLLCLTCRGGTVDIALANPSMTLRFNAESFDAVGCLPHPVHGCVSF